MKFHDQVVCFDYAGFPMVGNLINGFTIGLTPDGATLCKALLTESVNPDEVRPEDMPLFETLVANGFFDSGTPNKTALKSAYLHVTQRCNLNCKGCYSLDESRNVLKDAPLDSILHAIDELANIGCSILFISGGEPFLRSDLPEIVHHAKNAGIGSVTVITNGTYIDEKALSKMAHDVDTIAISIDGPNANAPAYIREYQRFDQLMDMVDAVKRAGINAHIVPTIHSKNIDDMKEYVELASSLGITFNYSLLSCHYGDPELDELIPSDEDLQKLSANLLDLNLSPSSSNEPLGVNITVSTSCGAGVKEISIAADGTVYPCHMLQDPSFALGNVFEEPLSEILSNHRSRTLRKLCIDDIEKCSDCEYGYLCGGGCRARSLYRYGDLNNKDGYCSMMHSYYKGLGELLKSQFS